eukprot:scaffold22612_cov138-Cylindrotheca_fusiformis.AAC.8
MECEYSLAYRDETDVPDRDWPSPESPMPLQRHAGRLARASRVRWEGSKKLKQWSIIAVLRITVATMQGE